jgi:hypothetical protein
VGLLAAGHQSGGIKPGTEARARFAPPIIILNTIPATKTPNAINHACQPLA